MYKFKNFLDKKDYLDFKKNKTEYKYLNIYKRSLLHPPTMYRSFDNQLFNEIEEKEFLQKEKLNEKLKDIKKTLFDEIFMKKKDKHKINFLKNNSILSEDLLSIIYDFYNQSRYVIAIKFIQEDYTFYSKSILTNNLYLVKNIFFNNYIDKVYKVNIDKFNNTLYKIFTIDFYEAFSQQLYNQDSESYYNISKIKTNNNFYAPIIVIKLYFYKKNKIKIKKFYISNYNILYIIRDFVINKKISKYEFFYINKITNYNNHKNLINISMEDIKKYNFLNEIYEYLIKLFKNNIEQYQM